MLEKDLEDHVVYVIEPLFSMARVTRILPPQGCAKWADIIKEPRTICSTLTSVFYWQEWRALASPCLLGIQETSLLVGNWPVQCVELGAEGSWAGGSLQVLSAIQFQPKYSHSEFLFLFVVNCSVKPLPLPFFTGWARRGKQKEGLLNTSTAL